MIRRWGGVLALAAVLLLFLVASFYQIRLPGLYFDEALDVVPAMQMALGQPGPWSIGDSILLGPVRLPLMTMTYVGSVSTYAVLPFFRLFGIGVESIRAMTIVMACLGLIFAYGFLNDLFDRRVAILSTLLLAIHPAFVLWSRMGIYVSSPMFTFATASLFFLLRWRRRGNPVYMYAAAFCLGLGLSTKLLFLWFIVALALTTLLLRLWPRVHVGRFTFGQDHNAPAINRRTVVGSLIGFTLGAGMILWYNLTTRRNDRARLA